MDISQHKGSEIPRLMWIIGSPIIFTVGVLGNIMTISVLSRPNYKKSSTSVFLMFLAVADLLVVTTILPRWWIIYMFNFDIRHLNNAFCKIHWFLTYFNGCFSSAILVAVTTGRIISIIRPYKVKTWCTVNNAIVTSVTIIVTLTASFGHTLHGMKLFTVTQYKNASSNYTIQCREDLWQFIVENSSNRGINTTEPGSETTPDTLITNITSPLEFEMKNSTSPFPFSPCNLTEPSVCVNVTRLSLVSPLDALLKTNDCETSLLYEETFKMCWFDDPTYGEFHLGVFQVFVIVVYNVVTEVSILIGVVVILRHLNASRKMRKKMRLNTSTRDIFTKPIKSTFESHSGQITRSLVLVNAMFLSCATPVQIFLLGRPFWIDDDKGMNETQEIIWAVVNLLFYTNHAVNFILYFLSGSQFRNQVMETLRCNIHKPRLNGASPSHHSIDTEMSNGRANSDYVLNLRSIS